MAHPLSALPTRPRQLRNLVFLNSSNKRKAVILRVTMLFCMYESFVCVSDGDPKNVFFFYIKVFKSSSLRNIWLHLMDVSSTNRIICKQKGY